MSCGVDACVVVLGEGKEGGLVEVGGGGGEVRLGLRFVPGFAAGFLLVTFD